jgi:hypothetical protein
MVTTCELQTMDCRPLLRPVISSQIKLNYCNSVSVLLTEVCRSAGLLLVPDNVFDGAVAYKCMYCLHLGIQICVLLSI